MTVLLIEIRTKEYVRHDIEKHYRWVRVLKRRGPPHDNGLNSHYGLVSFTDQIRQERDRPVVSWILGYKSRKANTSRSQHLTKEHQQT